MKKNIEIAVAVEVIEILIILEASGRGKRIEKKKARGFPAGTPSPDN